MIKDNIRGTKLQYSNNRVASKTSALWWDKTDKYECLAGEEMLLSDQSRMIKQTTCFPKQIKTIEDQGRKQVEALKDLKPVGHQQKPKSMVGIVQKDLYNYEITDEVNKTNKLKEKVDRNNMKNETIKYIYDFQLFQMTRS